MLGSKNYWKKLDPINLRDFVHANLIQFSTNRTENGLSVVELTYEASTFNVALSQITFISRKTFFVTRMAEHIIEGVEEQTLSN